MVAELFHDVKMLLEMRKYRDLAIKNAKEYYALESERKFHNLFEITRIRLETKERIVREEQHFADYKARLVRKWKGKLRKVKKQT